MRAHLILVLLALAAGCSHHPGRSTDGGTGPSNGDGGDNPGGPDGGGDVGKDGGGVVTGDNVVPMVVDNGPANLDYGSADVPFVSVTVCVPGTDTCATIDHISVDTGSTGLRLIASALPQGFTLPQQMTGGQPEAECFTFADGYVWGSVRLADLKLGGGTASNMQLQLVGDPAYPTVPSDCKATGSAENTVDAFGSNGIIGISQSLADCGSYCAQETDAGYYGCSGTSCTGVTMAVEDQLQNPISLFGSDNNGAVLTFPAVPEEGAETLSGSLIFGVGTRDNNALGSAQVLTVDEYNSFGTTYNGANLNESYLDSGTNLLSFTDKSLTQCKGDTAGFYCPAETTSKTATITGINGTAADVTFRVANTDTLFDSYNTAFDDLGGTGYGKSFAWGFPFFIGRTVFVGFHDRQDSGGYYAF